MSRNQMDIALSDGTTLHGLYEGTGGVAMAPLFPTEEGRSTFWENWRNDTTAFTGCGCEGEPCIAYQGIPPFFEASGIVGSAWLGKACREHLRFLGPLQTDVGENHPAARLALAEVKRPGWCRPSEFPDIIVAIPIAFQGIVTRLARTYLKRTPAPEELARIISWTE